MLRSVGDDRVVQPLRRPGGERVVVLPEALVVHVQLRQAQLALSEITGEFTSDDLLGRIFSSFCIGK